MNYYNWQEIHKNNYGTRAIKNCEVNNFNTNGLNETQNLVWQELKKSWQPGQLKKLLYLAKTYDKASDTFRFQEG